MSGQYRREFFIFPEELIRPGSVWDGDSLHPDFFVCRNRFGAEDLKELGAPAELGFIGAHFDDHLSASASTLARRAKKIKNAPCGNLVTLWKLVLR